MQCYICNKVGGRHFGKFENKQDKIGLTAICEMVDIFEKKHLCAFVCINTHI